jgi:uncharacterized membrane protein YraQ (UPF0718 family)/copper chaperone CopZ
MREWLEQLWIVTLELAPWLLLGLLVAGLLHVLLPPGFVRRFMGRPSFASTLKAVLLGVPMPLCSCGVIPAAIGLKKDGASNGAAIGFMISAPQTGADNFAVCYAFLGLPFALFSVVSTFVTGLIGGLLTDWLGPREKPAPAAPAPHCATAPAPLTWFGRLRELWRFCTEELLYMIWRWLVVGIVASAAISAWVPENALANQAWATGWLGLLVVLVIAVPLYVCSTSSIPLAAALIHAGLPPGAALVFLMAGPATNVATLGAVYRAFGGRTLAIYLGTIVGCSLVLGRTFDFVLGAGSAGHVHEHGGGGWLALPAALLLVALLARFAWRDGRALYQRLAQPPAGADTLSLAVRGMTCGSCANRVREALAAQPGVHTVQVDLESERATVTGQGLGQVDFPGVIRGLGFETD